MTSRRIGLLGGTFDPPHRGHAAAARLAQDLLGLDAIWFVPAAIPVGKPDASPFGQRVAATEQLVRVEAGRNWQVCPIEAELCADQATPTYTANTLEALVQEHPEAKFTLLVGSDVAASFDQWYRPHRVLELAELAIIVRPGWHLEVPPSLSQYVVVAGVLPEISSAQLREQPLQAT